MAAEPKPRNDASAAVNSISIVCPCGEAESVNAEFAGKKVPCGRCRRLLVVPGAAPAGQDESLASGHPQSQTLNDGPKTKRELYAFLAPAQTADELGRLGPYRVLKVLGAGGMGVVFKAEDPGLKRFVALKAMLPAIAENESAKERFLREARAAAALKHDHVVYIHQVGEDRGVPYLAMEFLDGESLEDRLRREGRLSIAEVLRIGREIADGLGAAHERGLIHRDIKPANVWMEARSVRRKDGASGASGQSPSRAKILDFGLARGADDATLTHPGMMIGTPAYMPPEQAGGETVDARVDLYSLGVVLYRMATGQLPFKGTTTLAVLAAVISQTPTEPRQVNPEIPARLSDLILRLLSKQPSERPASAHEVHSALDEIEVQPSARTPAEEFATLKSAPPPTKSSGGGKKKSWPLIAIGAGGLAILALLCAIVFCWPTPKIAKVDPVEPPPPRVEQPLEKSDSKPVVPPAKAGEEVENSIGMKLVWIPPGKFTMGSPTSEKERNDDEVQHEVEITKGFWFGKYPVTQFEYEAVTAENPSRFKGPKLPVETLNWSQAKDFCRKLSDREGKDYSLPTEAEWEYACRAGTKGPFSTGENLTTDQANYKGTHPYAGNAKGIYRQKTVEVGSFAANGFGLHDMHGNVFQWCEDWYGPYEQGGRAVDPKAGPLQGSGRVFRGGSWDEIAGHCRSAYRYGVGPLAKGAELGFRVALRSATPEPAKPNPPPEVKAAPVPPGAKAGEEIENSIGMKLVWIPPGKFTMGSPASEKERYDDEVQHEVEITKGFWLGKYPVTQFEYEAVTAENPSKFKGPKLPVETVDWSRAKDFCRRLSDKDGNDYSLPTEAEWEYACRAGTKGPFSTGENLTTDQANYKGTHPYAGNAKGIFREKTMKVGSFAANGFGLHDMHGNVSQWCEDWYGPYDKGGPAVDPKAGPLQGSGRVFRGGSWDEIAGHCRSAYRPRYGVAPSHRDSDLGFRVVLRSVK
jgi:eukaryotic-like serine/threonine-protein kinase